MRPLPTRSFNIYDHPDTRKPRSHPQGRCLWLLCIASYSFRTPLFPHPLHLSGRSLLPNLPFWFGEPFTSPSLLPLHNFKCMFPVSTSIHSTMYFPQSLYAFSEDAIEPGAGISKAACSPPHAHKFIFSPGVFQGSISFPGGYPSSITALNPHGQ